MATGAKITGRVTRWWWVRHAPVPNPEARCYGQSDKDCDVSNQALFEHQARLLPRGAVWYASNLLRARKTAEQLAAAGAEMDKLNIDGDLAEQHFGDWQGLTYVEIAEKHGNNHLFWLAPPEQRPPGGESFVDLARAHGQKHRPADRGASRPRHRGDGAWRHDPRRPRPRLRPPSRGRGALRDRQRVDHPDRAFRAGRSRPRLARGVRQLHAARARRGQGGVARMKIMIFRTASVSLAHASERARSFGFAQDRRSRSA